MLRLSSSSVKRSICICGGAELLAKRPKTADMMQDVFAAGGDMAQVPAP